jgi:hypothetical protein
LSKRAGNYWRDNETGTRKADAVLLSVTLPGEPAAVLVTRCSGYGRCRYRSPTVAELAVELHGERNAIGEAPLGTRRGQREISNVPADTSFSSVI